MSRPASAPILLACAPLAIAGVIACGGTTPESAGSTPMQVESASASASASASEVCLGLAAALHQRRYHCLHGDPPLAPTAPAQYEVLECQGFEEAVTAGRVRIDTTLFDACIASIAADQCTHDASFTYDPQGPCAKLIAPATAGASCRSDPECGSAASCPTEGFTCGPGVCTARRALGEPCGHGIECQYALACIDHVCRTDPGPTAILPIARLGERCDHTRCEFAAYCGADQRCVPLLPIGASCPSTPAGNNPCAEGFCGSSGTCQPMRGLGEACERASPCIRGVGLVCTAGRCQPQCSAQP